MDAVRIETLISSNSLIVNKNASKSTNISKESSDDFFVDEIDEDDEIRLRLSDDEEFEQDKISEQAKMQQTRLQLKTNDFKFDNCTSKEPPQLHSEKSLNKKNLFKTKTNTSISEDESSGNSSLDEKLAEKVSDLDVQETMSGKDRIPPLMQNSPKYWTNTFDKRWKGGVNSSRDRKFPHRNSNDWYNKQYPEKDKFKKKNFNGHHQNHFHNNKVRNESRDSFNNEPNSKVTKQNKQEINDTNILKNDSASCAEKSIVENDSISENGISEEPSLEENNSDEKKENLNFDGFDKSESTFTDKNNENNTENDVSYKQKSQNNDLDILKKDDTKNEEKLLPDTKNENSVLSINKDCDTSVELNEEHCESNSEENDHRDQESISKDLLEKPSDETNCSLEKVSEENKDSFEIENSTESKEETTEGLTDVSVSKDCKVSIEEPENSQILEKVSKKDAVNNSGDEPSVHSSILDSNSCQSNYDAETENQIEDESNEQNHSENHSKDEELKLHLNEDSNISLKSDKSLVISEMDITEHDDESVEEKKLITSEEKIEELMDVENDGESSSSFSIAATDSSQKSDSNESKVFDNSESENNFEKTEAINATPQLENIKAELQESKNQELLKAKEKSKNTDNEQEKVNIIEEVDLIDDDTEESSKDERAKTDNQTRATDEKTDKINNTIEKVSIGSSEIEKTQKKRRRRKEKFFQGNLTNDTIMENGARQKRRSAKNAEEMIRKGILKNDEDDDDSSDSSRLVSFNYKKFNLPEPLSPPTLKRSFDDADSVNEETRTKKMKATLDDASSDLGVPETKEDTVKNSEKTKINELVKAISQEDIRKKIKKMTKKEIEAILVQKVVECIAVRGEMGKLREQARNSQRNLEATRAKCQQLQKQVEGFDMVLKRMKFDEKNGDKFVQPIKINRSVGLQVNFVADHGIMSLKQMQMLKSSGSNASSYKPSLTISTNSGTDNRSVNQSPKKTVKTRPPRRPEMPTPPTLHPILNTNTTSTTNCNSHSTVANKSVDSSSKRYSLPPSTNIVHLVPQQAVVINSNVNISSTITRPTSSTVQRSNGVTSNKSNDLIDLTDEEEKTKTQTVSTTTSSISTVPRVLKAVPANVTLNNSTNLRLVQAGNPGAPTTIVNNLNNPTVAYVMQNGVIGQRQLLLKSATGIRQVAPGTTRNIPTISYKQGVQAINSVRVLTTSNSTPNLQQIARQHPAPLPETPQTVTSNPQWKLPPPAPSLKINKVATGIVLSWNMNLSDKFAKIVSYQLFAYQEIAGTAPNAALWKKVGDVAALPLPMACTLTQFTEGNNYHFAVRAVDAHSRYGQYSKPGNISL